MTNYFKVLPNEILNLILFEYWYDYFRNNVLLELAIFKTKINHINRFIEHNYYIGFLADNEFKMKLPIIQNISNVLNELVKYRHYRIILSKNYRYLDICINQSYINNCLSDIDKKYKNVAALCINNCHPESRFNLKYKFSMLK